MSAAATRLQAPGHLGFARPAGRSTLCIEPLSRGLDAFHLPGRPGLVTLESGQGLSLQVQRRVEAGG